MLLGCVSTLTFYLPNQGQVLKAAALKGQAPQTQVNIAHNPRLNLEPSFLPPRTVVLTFVAIFLARGPLPRLF